MQAIELIEMCMAALGGAVVGIGAQRWQSRQRIVLLKQRLTRAEEARNHAVERSDQAREQIAQLSKSIADMRRAHQPSRGNTPRPPETTAEERRAVAERALAAVAEAEPPPSGKVVAVANTEPMQY